MPRRSTVDSALSRRRLRRGGHKAPKGVRPLTLKALGQAIGYSESHLSGVETGRERAGDNLIEALARFHKAPMDTIRREAEQAYRAARK